MFLQDPLLRVSLGLTWVPLSEVSRRYDVVLAPEDRSVRGVNNAGRKFVRITTAAPWLLSRDCGWRPTFAQASSSVLRKRPPDMCRDGP